MDNKRFRAERVQLCTLALAVLVLLVLLLRVLALHLAFDADIGYFQKGAPLCVLLYIFEGLLLALLVAIPFLISNTRVRPITKSPSTPEMVGCMLSALLLLLPAGYLLLKGRTQLSALALVSILAALFSLLAAGFFLCRLLSVSDETRALFGYALILAAALLMLVAYFDRYTQMNAPHKLTQHFSMLAVMLATLFEIRALLSKDLPRVRLAVSAAAFAICTVFSLSNAIAFCTGVYDDLTYLFFDLPVLGLAVYYAAKCLSAVFGEAQDGKEEA